jgi:hypothetical protein
MNAQDPATSFVEAVLVSLQHCEGLSDAQRARLLECLMEQPALWPFDFSGFLGQRQHSAAAIVAQLTHGRADVNPNVLFTPMYTSYLTSQSCGSPRRVITLHPVLLLDNRIELVMDMPGEWSWFAIRETRMRVVAWMEAPQITEMPECPILVVAHRDPTILEDLRQNLEDYCKLFLFNAIVSTDGFMVFRSQMM